MMQNGRENKWLFKTSPDEKSIASFADELNLHPVLVKLLIQRGIHNLEEAKTFFRPSLGLLHDPFLMKDMDKAVERVKKALRDNEKILILGDYDVDGTTATALSVNFLSRLCKNLEYYIPDRYAEGYGISDQSIDYAIDQKVDLMISLDCGIKAVDKVRRAGENGVDFIICDHHTPGDALPPALAVLDPKRSDCNYPFDSLSGAGVAFKLMQALSQELNLEEDWIMEELDLLATSNAADIVPIVGENRILTRFGLEKINSNPKPGIRAIMDVSGSIKNYKISDVVFKIAPRINSAGRMASGKKAVEILTAKNVESARQVVEEVNQLNNERRDLDRDITERALEQIRNEKDYENKKSTVLYDPNWNKGVIGIVASRLIENYYRPTVILTGSEGILSGSARSVKNFDLYEALEQCSEHLLQFGGHKYAAGMTMREDQFSNFKSCFEKVVSESIREEHLQPCIDIDTSIRMSEINGNFYKHLRQFAPFGPGNMNPVFHSEKVMIYDFRLLTDRNQKQHLKFKVMDADNEDISFDVIGFGMGHRADQLDDGVLIDLVYNIEENHWNGRTTLQFVAKDFKIH